MSLHYILKNKVPVPCDDFDEWERFFRSPERIIKRSKVGKYEISTVFLGIDQGYGNQKLFFETMIFYKKNGWNMQSSLEYQTRCETYDECQLQHETAERFVKAILKERKIVYYDKIKRRDD